MIKPLRRVLIKRPEDAFISQAFMDENYKKFNFTSSVNLKEAIKEHAEFERLLRDNVEEVLCLPKDDLGSIDSIYTHDCVKVTPKGAIYMPMGKALRAREKEATRAFLENLGLPTLGEIKAPAKIEAGDIIFLNDLCLIGRGFRTNDAGIAEFKKLTQGLFKEYIIFQLPIALGEDECLHLMSVLSMVDLDKALVFYEYMPVAMKDLLDSLKITQIEINRAEYDALASNALCLKPGKIIMPNTAPRVKDILSSLGVEVLTYKGDEISFKGTGGPTCLTCPVLRG